MSGVDLSANTFLRMGKATPENLDQYCYHNGRFRLLKLLFLLLLFLPNSLFEVTFQIIRIFALKEKKPNMPNTTKISYESIFVSHHTLAATNKEDLYFGLLPVLSQSILGKSAVFMINHTKIGTLELHKLLKFRKDADHFVSSKTLPIGELLRIVYQQFVVGIQMVSKAILIKNASLDFRTLLLHAAIKQLSKPTLASIILVRNIEKIVANLKPKRILITFEGHSFELLTLKMIHNRYPNVRVMLYQFAPLVKTQYGFFETLTELRKSDIVFTTGKTTRDYVLRNSSLLENQVVILGSPKTLPLTLGIKLKQHNLSTGITCLFAAEASKEDTHTMLELALHCSRALPNKKFILRLHPAYHFDGADMLKAEKNFPYNLCFSRNNLEDDLRIASFCVYRSTAVAIQGLAEGVRPIHYSSFSDNELDPLAVTSLWHKNITNAGQLISYLDSVVESEISGLEPSLDQMMAAYRDYFQPINEQAIVHS